MTSRSLVDMYGYFRGKCPVHLRNSSTLLPFVYFPSGFPTTNLNVFHLASEFYWFNHGKIYDEK